jgi:hypothetical protein
MPFHPFFVLVLKQTIELCLQLCYYPLSFLAREILEPLKKPSLPISQFPCRFPASQKVHHILNLTVVGATELAAQRKCLERSPTKGTEDYAFVSQ